MSCFLHDIYTYNSLHTFFHNQGFSLDYVWCNLKMTSDNFIKALVKYNIKAFNQRYQDRYKDDCASLRGYSPELVSKHLTPIEAFKLLQSIDYQCIDSDEYCDWAVKHTQAVMLAIAESIIRQMPSYEAASWS